MFTVKLPKIAGFYDGFTELFIFGNIGIDPHLLI